LMKKIFTKKRKASMMDILATASCKSLWMEWCKTLETRVLMGSVTIDHMVLVDTKTKFD
jgi:hypothetical protein